MSISASHVTETDPVARRPQFGLRALLLAITLISVVCAVFVAIGPVWSAMLALSVSLIGLHIAGNAIGTRLQEDAPRRAAEDPASKHPLPGVPAARRLQEHASIDHRCWMAAVAGVVVGAILGGACVSLLAGHRLTTPGLVLGVVSSAVLGGLFCFLASSSFLVAHTAWREALQALDEPPSAPHAALAATPPSQGQGKIEVGRT